MFEILDRILPLSLAVINCSRRVAIIYCSALTFGTTMTIKGFTGCVIAILGVFLFSASKIYCPASNLPSSK